MPLLGPSATLLPLLWLDPLPSTPTWVVFMPARVASCSPSNRPRRCRPYFPPHTTRLSPHRHHHPRKSTPAPLTLQENGPERAASTRVISNLYAPASSRIGLLCI